MNAEILSLQTAEKIEKLEKIIVEYDKEVNKLSKEITDLQEKIKHIANIRDKVIKENNRLREDYILLQNASYEYEDELQERIDRAIEYINYQVLIDYANNNEYNFKDTPTGIDLLNILNGGDK